MNEYKVTTEKGIEYVYAERYDIFDGYASKIAQFYRGKYICHHSYGVISVELIEE